MSSSETVKAIAILSGSHSSQVATATYSITTIPVTTPTAAPVFSPATGNYASIQSVSIFDATPGAAISYAITNGSPPTGFIPYAGPITVSSSATIFAQATATGFTASPLASAAYTFTLPVAATPLFSPPAVPSHFAAICCHLRCDAQERRSPMPSPMARRQPVISSHTQALSSSRLRRPSSLRLRPAGFTARPRWLVLPILSTLPIAAATPTISPLGRKLHIATAGHQFRHYDGSGHFLYHRWKTAECQFVTLLRPNHRLFDEIVQAIAVANGYSDSAVASAAFTLTLAASGVGT